MKALLAGAVAALLAFTALWTYAAQLPVSATFSTPVADRVASDEDKDKEKEKKDG